jgi:phosphoglycerate dehydrogenase-like enzyme
MDILLVDPLVPEALAWLQERYQVVYQPELADDLPTLKAAIAPVRGLLLPSHVVVSREFLEHAPKLEVLARLQISTDNTDLEACSRRQVRVLQARSATVRANAEYLLYGLLMLYRRGMVSALLGRTLSQVRMGRELGGSTVGLLGLAPVAHTLAPMLRAMGVRVLGYDPAVHHAADLWKKLDVEPVSAQDLLAQSDAISLQMVYASRFKGWINERLLNHCKPGQLWVGVSRGALFDPEALALALCDGRIDACLLDGANAQFAAPGSPLHGIPNLHLTPRLGAHTREAKLRSSWYIVHRMHETLSPNDARRDSAMGELSLLDSLDFDESVQGPASSPSPWRAMAMRP